MLVPVTEAEIAGASNLHFFLRFTLMENVLGLENIQDRGEKVE